MVSPQVENGYTKIANELLRALIAHRVPGEQMQCLLLIIRKTYGYNKKWDTISNSQFVEFTGLNKSSVCRAINSLVEKNIVYKNANKYIPSYCFNKNYDKWILLTKKSTVDKKVNGCLQKGKSLLTKKRPTKETITKETITKETINVEDFPRLLSLKLLKHIKSRNDNFKKPDLEKWAQHVEYMIRLDKRDPLEIFIVIGWCQESNFWKNNILSTHKLRKQYDQLKMKMEGEKDDTFHNRLIKRGQQWLKRIDQNS